MTNNDEFDVDLELEDGDAEVFAEESGFEEEQPVKAKKSGGGFLVKFLLFLVLVAGGLFAGVKYLGVQLPFDVPYLNELAGVQAPATPPQPAQQAGAVDLSTGAADTPAAMEAMDGWTDDPAAAVTGADTGNAMSGDPGIFDDSMSGDTAGAADGATLADEFGLPPATEDATDLSATDTGAADTAADVWGAVPATQQDTPPAALATDDPFGASVTETPATTFAAPADMAADTAKAAAVAAPANNAALADLEKKLAALEKSLADLRSNTATKSDIEALKASFAKSEKSAADVPAAVKAEKAAAKPAAVEEAKPAAAKKAVPATQKAPVARKSWVLRSAKPGMAWISEKGSGEIKTISVGDTVVGIGKVTAIAKDGSGRWVVSGTRGKINQ